MGDRMSSRKKIPSPGEGTGDFCASTSLEKAMEHAGLHFEIFATTPVSP
jgi:hypothetical protein